MGALAINMVEKPSSSSIDREPSASSTSTSSRKSVRFASKEIVIFDAPSTHATPSARPENIEEQSLPSSSSTSPTTSSNKKVRFADDSMVIWHHAAVPRATPPQADTTCIKPTSFANDPKTSSAPSPPHSSTYASYHTLLDTDTSLQTPLESPEPPFPPPLASPSDLVTTQPPIQPSTSSSSHEEYPNPAPSPPSPHHHTIEHPHTPAPALPLDPGEKDAQGRVLAPRTEPCERCGGQVVWATKGEWLLVCEGCGEAQ